MEWIHWINVIFWTIIGVINVVNQHQGHKPYWFEYWLLYILLMAYMIFHAVMFTGGY